MIAWFSDERFEEATQRSVRWLDRCIAAHRRPEDQNLFAIIQGGLDTRPGGLRDVCLEQMIARGTPGYAIGGLAGGEDKVSFGRVVEHCTRKLPADKARYLMGVGYPLDLVVCVALGVDMFDCVYPTRTARFGTALIPAGTLRLKARECAEAFEPVDAGCSCLCCRTTTRAHLHVLFKENSPVACQLLTMHNVAYMMRLMRTMRQAIVQGDIAYAAFIREFLDMQFPDGGVPTWVTNALRQADVNI
jgi:tRNA-guanine family transglycosylase